MVIGQLVLEKKIFKGFYHICSLNFFEKKKKSKKFKYHLLQFLFGALGVKYRNKWVGDIEIQKNSVATVLVCYNSCVSKIIRYRYEAMKILFILELNAGISETKNRITIC